MRLFFLFFALANLLIADPIQLRVIERKITVNGKEAAVYGIAQPDGTLGLTVKKGESFQVELTNDLKVPTSVHWHGLILPNAQDGVAFITQFPIYPGESYAYEFPLVQTGTFWMHSHVGLQEQKLLVAPLILLGSEPEPDVVVLLSDFSFTPASEIFHNLQCKMKMGGGPDLVEVDYDAFLANYRTLNDPEIIPVEPGTRYRLRIINGSSATNFFLNPGTLRASAVAVDGNGIVPFLSSQFELAVAQRIDLIVTIPKEGGAFPILAQAQGTAKQTGVILATEKAPLPNIQPAKTAGALTNAQEGKLRALAPLLLRQPDQKFNVELNGNMKNYVWTMNGQSWPETTPLLIEEGKRIEITFANKGNMSHPMHLHGHVFQVTAINGKPLSGAKRDTVLVPPQSTLTIQFDADNPGVWPLHCHILYHLEAGMLTVVRYKGFNQPL